MSHLGNLEQLLGDLNNIAQWLDVLDSCLDGLGVPCPGGVQDILEFLLGVLAPFLVHGTTILEDTVEDSQQTEGDDGFLVENVEFVADCPYGDTSTSGKDRGLGS